MVLDLNPTALDVALAPLRVRAARDARMLRRLARIALTDGSAHGPERARRAREAARTLVVRARRMTVLLSAVHDGEPPRSD